MSCKPAGKSDLGTMANNVGQRSTIKVAERCNPEQNCPPYPILPPAEAVYPAITPRFLAGLNSELIERRSTPRAINYTVREKPPYETD